MWTFELELLSYILKIMSVDWACAERHLRGHVVSSLFCLRAAGVIRRVVLRISNKNIISRTVVSVVVCLVSTASRYYMIHLACLIPNHNPRSGITSRGWGRGNRHTRQSAGIPFPHSSSPFSVTVWVVTFPSSVGSN